VINRIDALLTLTELSLLADKTASTWYFYPLNLNHLPNLSRGTLTWHDSCTFVVAGSLRNRFEIRRSQACHTAASIQPLEEVLKAFPEHTDEQMWSALTKADKAFRAWAARPFSERSKTIARAAQVLLEKKEVLAHLATLEMGKRIAESRGEVELSASIMQNFADKAEVFLAPKKLDSAMGDARLEYSPFGVLLSIQPWNYPYYQLARFAGPHLMSGNVMLLKHAPGVPQCALAFE